MRNLICSQCKVVFQNHDLQCENCGNSCYDFSNNDAFLLEEAEKVQIKRIEFGLEGLVGGLEYIIINTEPERQEAAIQELLNSTGFEFKQAFEDEQVRTAVLATKGSADILVQSRKQENPFSSQKVFPKAAHLPNTRLETFVFKTTDIDRYVSIQLKQGIRFLTETVVESAYFRFIQTIPSSYSGISYGYIEWKTRERNYISYKGQDLKWEFSRSPNMLIRKIKELDHTAARVEAKDRDAAIIEFMTLTNYNFKFSVYVKIFNSITNVARLSKDDFAMVFTSGIHPYIDEDHSGPTEKFIHNYGPRVHHMAFRMERIEDTFEALKENGMEFLIGLVGNEKEGLKQTFSEPSENTLLVNEYIHRYGDFDGFFTASNVTLLTGATDKQ
jgi:4-hydroxyphenylpyruvate dioxygenase-like putative hemolysin